MEINCQNLVFNSRLLQSRIETAYRVFGEKTVKRIIMTALYWLGVDRPSIANIISMPVNTVKSTIKSLLTNGLCALEDRRQTKSVFIPVSPPSTKPLIVTENNDGLILDFKDNRQIFISSDNKYLQRCMILLLYRNKLLSSQTAADTLDLSAIRILGMNHLIGQSS